MNEILRLFVILGAASLLLTASAAAEEPNRFAVAGLSETQARTFFEKLQNVIRSGNGDRLADLMSFPLFVHSSSNSMTVGQRADFLAGVNRIFTPDIRARILSQRFDDFFANGRGVMIANGSVWFSGICSATSSPGSCEIERVLVVSVNLDAPT
ncbi:MAG TPA: hypothetical protein VGK20_19210 [Candidatus Binatia bacterium]